MKADRARSYARRLRGKMVNLVNVAIMRLPKMAAKTQSATSTLRCD
jgi:hypothetical protein